MNPKFPIDSNAKFQTYYLHQASKLKKRNSLKEFLIYQGLQHI